VDIGVRSYHLAGIGLGRLWLFDHCVPVKGKVEDQKPGDRWLELTSLAKNFTTFIDEKDKIFIEEPPLAGPKNLRVYGKLHQTVGALFSVCPAITQLVPVDTWKMEVCGKGGLSKEDVASFLKDRQLAYYEQCEGNQNYIDAVCIALYGLKAG